MKFKQAKLTHIQFNEWGRVTHDLTFYCKHNRSMFRVLGIQYNFGITTDFKKECCIFPISYLAHHIFLTKSWVRFGLGYCLVRVQLFSLLLKNCPRKFTQKEELFSLLSKKVSTRIHQVSTRIHLLCLQEVHNGGNDSYIRQSQL